jgi:hypothetical protein
MSSKDIDFSIVEGTRVICPRFRGSNFTLSILRTSTRFLVRRLGPGILSCNFKNITIVEPRFRGIVSSEN